MNVSPLNRVIVIAQRRDLAVNRLAIPMVLEHIAARRYLMAVPASDVEVYRREMPSAVDILSEESVLAQWNKDAIARTLPAKVAQRAGWYLQQFLKIELAMTCAPGERSLILDGDTLPLRPLSFEDVDGRIGLYTGKEFHPPYFATIRRLLDLPRGAGYSYIAQCMCVRPVWIEALIDSIERRSGTGWIESVLRSIPGDSVSEFSEFETIGTFVASRFPSEIYLKQRPWFRWGRGYFGGDEELAPERLRKFAALYDFIALESWDRGIKAWFRSRSQLAMANLRQGQRLIP